MTHCNYFAAFANSAKLGALVTAVAGLVEQNPAHGARPIRVVSLQRGNALYLYRIFAITA